MHTRVKICGITHPDDARLALTEGADALGMVFYAPSPRAVDPAQAQIIARAVGPFATLVGLFVDADANWVRTVLAQVPVKVLQFHGDETPAYCDSFGLPYIKAIRMRTGLDLPAVMAQHTHAEGFLLDAYRPGVPGGTGETFDWDRVPRNSERPVILAGGLTPDNVSIAVASTRPYAVDVSGGVEASPGRKDPRKVKTFIHNAKHGITGDAKGD